MTSVGAFLDTLVWYYGKNLDLYGDNDKKENENKSKRLSRWINVEYFFNKFISL